MEVYNRKDLVRMRELEKYMMLNPLDDQIVIVKLEKNINLRGTIPRCILNTYLFEVFDEYKLTDEYKRKFIYRDNYLKGRFNKYMNFIIDEVKDVLENAPVMLPHLLGDMFSCFHRLAIKCGHTLSMDHSLMGYITAYRENKDFRKLIDEPIIKKADDPWSAEKKYKEINKIVEEANIHPISDFIKSGVKANALQIMGFVQVGLQPDYLDPGRVKNNTTSGMLGGLRNIEDMFHQDNQALEAVIKGKNEVQEPGALGKLINIALTETKLNLDVTRAVVHDCKTKDTLDMEIKDEDDLEFFRFNYYVDDSGKIIGYVDTDRKDLIGKKLKMRAVSHCKASECVCECCAGANHKFLQDTELYKNNMYEQAVHETGAKNQEVISIKHANNANLKKIPCKYNGKQYANLIDLFKELDIMDKWEFDIVYIKDVNRVVVEPEEGRRYPKLFIDGIEVEMHDKPISLEENKLHVYIQNGSVLLKAKDLQVMLKSHTSASTAILPEEKWDRGDYYNLSRQEQITSFYNYCRTKIPFKHSKYYEMLVHSMARDAEDLSSKPTEQTQKVEFIRINQLTSSSDKSKRLSNKIHHGYINKNIFSIVQNTEACEADVLYNIIGDRDIDESAIATDLWNVLYTYNKDVCLINDKMCSMMNSTYDSSAMSDDEEDDED